MSPSTAELTAAGATVQLAAEVRDQNGQLVAGDTLRLAAEAFDENGYAVARESFTWSSSDVSVASVDGSGLVRGASEGKATITAAGGDVSGAATVTVAHGNSATWTASKPSISPRMS
ncbi:Ig-like domain-containing protein [Candidatus Palauibacter sp.]|uniref:Ig-like domain-containing protein n=1 Tax=Candidatus Palauibacter sp. TaxID=3101350 RepID=UPI003B5258A0